MLRRCRLRDHTPVERVAFLIRNRKGCARECRNNGYLGPYDECECIELAKDCAGIFKRDGFGEPRQADGMDELFATLEAWFERERV